MTESGALCLVRIRKEQRSAFSSNYQSLLDIFFGGGVKNKHICALYTCSATVVPWLIIANACVIVKVGIAVLFWPHAIMLTCTTGETCTISQMMRNSYGFFDNTQSWFSGRISCHRCMSVV